MAQVTLCSTSDIESGGKRIFDVGGKSIVVARVGDEFFALRSACPHQGAPLGEGRLGGTMVPSGVGEYCFGRVGEILRCPWHGFEFDVRTGLSLHDPVKMRVKSYSVTVVGTDVVVDA
jgi:nitrite reductase (NADH) small subunit